jgi:hypothetical protein
MTKGKFIKEHIGTREVSHGRFTLQNCGIEELKDKVLTFTGGIVITEISSPSPKDPKERYSLVFIPKDIKLEKAYSKTAKTAFTLRCDIGGEKDGN